jgi:CHAD domain-containing protein
MPKPANRTADAHSHLLTRHPLKLLRQADAACARLNASRDAEALHDFRVALRRLRTWLQLFRNDVGVDAGLLRKLRRLARRSNRERDLQIELDWLRAQLPAVVARDRAWLRRALRQRMRAYRAGLDELREHLRRKWPAQARALRRALRASTGNLSGPLLTRVARRCVADLRAELHRVHALHDLDSMHRARIRAKRIRYLFEPFRAVAPELDAAIRRLTALQDVAGALHDRAVIIDALVHAAQTRAAEVLRESTRASSAPALNTLAAELSCSRELVRRARREQQRLFAELRATVLGSHVTELHGELTRCVRLLSRA